MDKFRDSLSDLNPKPVEPVIDEGGSILYPAHIVTTVGLGGMWVSHVCGSRLEAIAIASKDPRIHEVVSIDPTDLALILDVARGGTGGPTT